MYLRQVAWDSSSNKVANVVSLLSTSWFKENEDLGDIIKVHRQLVTQVQILERENKALKARIVYLDNRMMSLESKFSVLKKGGTE